MLAQSDPKFITFPNVEFADENGLLAHGGDLQATTLLSAYQQGVFPWFSDDQPILWWSPDPRMVLFTDAMRCSRSLRKRLRAKPFRLSCDNAFADVIQQCSAPRSTVKKDHSNNKNNDISDDDADADSTWITAEMDQAYCHLHSLGYAHSIECWQNDELVGGLYGVAVNNVFFGESMFSRQNDSSKIALFYLCEFLRAHNVAWIDCQVESPHLSSLGATTMPRKDFINDIQQALQTDQTIVWQEFADFVKSHKLLL